MKHKLTLIALLCGCGSGSLGTSNPAPADMEIEADLPEADAQNPEHDAAIDVEQDITEEPDLPVIPVIQDVITGESNGTIRTFLYDAETGELTARFTEDSATTLDFVAFHPVSDVIYAASGASVRAYRYTPDTGELSYLGAGTTANGATHLEVDHTGRYVFTASYGGHSLSMLRLNADATPQDSMLNLGGTSDPGFCQNAHQVRVHPSNRFVYVPCLGSDHIRILSFDADTGTLTSTGTASVPANSGPRHMDFHPTLDRAYVINERSSTVSVFDVNPSTGELTLIETVNAVANASGSAGSDIHVAPDGRHLYAINRQPLHHIATFDIGAGLTLRAPVPGGGEHARSFAIDAPGNRLLVANRDSRNIVAFERAEDGSLTQSRIVSLEGPPWFVGFYTRKNP